MINEHFGILAALITLSGILVYVRDTLRGTTSPNRVSWGLWIVSPAIAFAAELAEHTSLEVAALTFVLGFGPLLVVIASFLNRKAYWQLTRFDLFCGSVSIVALVMWLVTGQGTVAILFSMLANMFATVPTIVKSYTHPQSETAATFVLDGIGATITILTIKSWTLANYGFPVMVLVFSILIASLILIPRPQKVIIER